MCEKFKDMLSVSKQLKHLPVYEYVTNRTNKNMV